MRQLIRLLQICVGEETKMLLNADEGLLAPTPSDFAADLDNDFVREEIPIHTLLNFTRQITRMINPQPVSYII